MWKARQRRIGKQPHLYRQYSSVWGHYCHITSSSSPSVPSDSDEECCWQPSLALILIFKLLAPRIKCFRASADAELVEGSWPNQKPLSLWARIFFFSGQMFLYSLGQLFSFLYPKTFFLLISLYIRVSAKSFHVWILWSPRCKKKMQITWNTNSRWAVAAKIHRGDSPIYKIMTPS